MSQEAGTAVVHGRTELTRQDLRAYQRYGQWREARWLTITQVFAGGCLVAAWARAVPHAPVAAGFVALAFGGQVLHDWLRLKATATAPPGSVTFTADAEGLTLEWPERMSRTAWSSVRRLDEVDGHFFVGVMPLQAYVVPKRAFASAADVDLFRRLATRLARN